MVKLFELEIFFFICKSCNVKSYLNERASEQILPSLVAEQMII